MRNPESEFIQKMGSACMMPIFYNPDLETSLRLIEVSYEAGIRVIEMVNRGKEATRIFPELRKLADQMPGLSLGVGTIYHPWQAEEFVDQRAEFIVAPVMNPVLGKWCMANDIPWVPGCGTVTEVWEAQELGAELVKVYPANVLTPTFVSSIHAVLPTIEIIPTGGVEPTAESMKPWFDAGVLLVGMGSQLFDKNLIKNKQWTELKNRIQAALALAESFKEI
ncbi:bifunctional 4-hydroxy-2-oxoglutarate aldolase/2-dehydro-3-deoxy-phosphogluconate aldolase [Algoriphagus limi]|uniref:Bifunctional 4-hydroxy-2-oxoglutarate aldolase/2-dehydro-3-deoxy-phosphogluconate aldolase n=1 Tax=Algoriphagus limi TaxID=2975273 RepID=A0ABT2G512_9BACT|nr:bifunctional 4-hydroxy-2-oxoglutarate aldolase/2-dehydro-3-deoxy-phosphogluconate aldolase [Algoriphagus limi]MCS5489531.1 bifunctional 4-hydroxy-2-oxoglutarate aldolase/2-dehydro-3-deoxy-phosphogluconate aldolase [Algoriphagus limi]